MCWAVKKSSKEHAEKADMTVYHHFMGKLVVSLLPE